MVLFHNIVEIFDLADRDRGTMRLGVALDGGRSGVTTVANMLPKDYNVRLVDMNVRPLTDADLQWADLVCTSTMIVQRKSLEHVIARAKRTGKLVVAGGPHPTSYWEDIEDVDYFFLGEVEDTFPRFLRDVECGMATRLYLPREKPAITQTPLPRYDLITTRADGSMLLQFSRGCPFDCEFCDMYQAVWESAADQNA